ncbi:MAG: Bax inhibitor-1/YccA family protein [Myxococcales bacterium]
MPAFQTYSTAPASPVAFSEAQRAFMNRVYGWMFVGLGATAATAFATATTPAAMRFVASSWVVLMLVEFGLVLALSFLATRMNSALAGLMFLAYSVVNGLTLSAIFFVYRLGTIGNAFAVTAGVFGAMTLYATVTRKDLSGWGSFLFIGLIGVVVAGVVNLFVMNDLLGFVISCACVVVFAGLTAYDTQKLRNYFATAYAGGGTGSLAVVGALMLYLDFVNLFLAILRLFGRRD